MPQKTAGIGDQFQKETRYNRYKEPAEDNEVSEKPELYKTYPDAKKISLPKDWSPGKQPINKLLEIRCSVRQYADEPIKLEHLAFLLWATTGIQRTVNNRAFRTAPSAGARFPIETYLVINNVSGIEPGLYHYNIKDHALETLRTGDLRREITEAAMGQEMCGQASVVFIWSAIFDRMKWRYRQRAYRYIYLDAGHIAENLALAAVSLDMGTCQIGAFFDDLSDKVIDVDGTKESVIYMSTVGCPEE